MSRGLVAQYSTLASRDMTGGCHIRGVLMGCVERWVEWVGCDRGERVSSTVQYSTLASRLDCSTSMVMKTATHSWKNSKQWTRERDRE